MKKIFTLIAVAMMTGGQWLRAHMVSKTVMQVLRLEQKTHL